jgi:hypothetical protein
MSFKSIPVLMCSLLCPLLMMLSANAAFAGGVAGDEKPITSGAASLSRTPEWEKMGSDDGIDVYKRETEGSPILAFRGEGIVDASITRVASVILDDSRSTEWVDNLEDSRLVHMYGEREFMQYSHFGMPFLVKDRDFLIRGKVEADPVARTLAMTIKSATDPAVPEDKYVRGDLIFGQWIMREVDGGKRTFVSTEMQADPKGALPKWLVNLFQKSWPHNTISRLRKQAARADIKIIPQVAAIFSPPPLR